MFRDNTIFLQSSNLKRKKFPHSAACVMREQGKRRKGAVAFSLPLPSPHPCRPLLIARVS